MGVLKQLEQGKIDQQTAYNNLYGRRARRAHFLFIRIWLKKEFFVSLLINVLFFLPWPLLIVRPFLKFIPEEFRNIYHDVRRYCGGASIDVKTSDVKLYLRLF